MDYDSYAPEYGIGLPTTPGGFAVPNYSHRNVTNNEYNQGQNTQQQVDIHQFDTPEITIKGKDTIMPNFTRKVTGSSLVEDEVPQETHKKRRGRPPKVQDSKSDIIRADDKTTSKDEALKGTVETPTSYTYQDTTRMLYDIVNQQDTLNSTLVQEFTDVLRSRTMKNKYNVLVGLSENINDGINNKITAIKEINSSISKSNDLDYKRQKDLNALQAQQSDDKYIADMYNAFINNPQAVPQQPQIPSYDFNPNVAGSTGIIRADLTSTPANNSNAVDSIYMNYVEHLTPEQNLMRYENNPDVKQCVIFDAQTGAKFFQYVNLKTGQPIPNLPVYDQTMMEDVTMDIKNKVAKNNNLHETFPIVVINEGVTNQY